MFPGHLRRRQSYGTEALTLTCGVCARSEVSIRTEMQDIQLLSGKSLVFWKMTVVVNSSWRQKMKR